MREIRRNEEFALFDEIGMENDGNNLKELVIETNPSVVKVLVSAIKRENWEIFKEMHEYCFVMIIIACVETWRMN